MFQMRQSSMLDGCLFKSDDIIFFPLIEFDLFEQIEKCNCQEFRMSSSILYTKKILNLVEP